MCCIRRKLRYDPANLVLSALLEGAEPQGDMYMNPDRRFGLDSRADDCAYEELLQLAGCAAARSVFALPFSHSAARRRALMEPAMAGTSPHDFLEKYHGRIRGNGTHPFPCRPVFFSRGL
jgi:hypothetical protein